MSRKRQDGILEALVKLGSMTEEVAERVSYLREGWPDAATSDLAVSSGACTQAQVEEAFAKMGSGAELVEKLRVAKSRLQSATREVTHAGNVARKLAAGGGSTS